MTLRLRIERRPAAPAWLTLAALTAALVAGLACVGLIFAAKGADPLQALSKIFLASFGSLYGLKETVTKAIPLILVGVGLSLAFKARFWNIGAEGQMLGGAIAATWLALSLGDRLPAPAMVPLMFIAGLAAGGLWGLVPALLRVKLGINEVISTLMLNYIAAELVQLLVYGPWKGKNQWGFPYTDNFSASATLGLIPGSRIHTATLVLALAAALVVYLVMKRSRLGFEVRVIGNNPEAGRFAGIDFSRTTLVVMLLSGGLAGLAGVGEVAGIHHHLSYPWSITSGYGFTGIIVAWIARLNPLLVILSSLFFSGILVGGDAIQTSLGLPFATVNVFNGLLLFFLIAADFLVEYKIAFSARKA